VTPEAPDRCSALRSPRVFARGAALLVVLGLAALTTQASAQRAPGGKSPLAGAPGVLAVEDTIPIPSALLPEYVVTAPRVSLDEILRRVAEGEAHRDSLMKDQSYTMVALLTYLDADNKPATGAKRKLEYASKVYKKQPDKIREVPLRRSSDFKKDDNVEVSSAPTMREQMVSFAFEPRNRSKFDFAIAERRFVGGHVVYVINFTPRSKIDPLPTGRVWIDTNDFVIVREEFWFRDRSPAPLIFKRIDSCVVERTKVDGQWWVISRVLARLQMTSAVRFMAKIAKEPLSPTVDFAVVHTDWRINKGIDDSVFAGAKK